MQNPKRIGYVERDAVEYLKRSRKAKFKTDRGFLTSCKKRGTPAGFVRKEAQVPWQTLKIPFITGRPGLAETTETTSRAAGHNLYRSTTMMVGSENDQDAIPGPVKSDSFI